MRRRGMLAGLGAAGLAARENRGQAQAPAHVQGWARRPVRLVVPFPAGGPPDVLGRAMAEALSARWGQPVVIENRPGAGGNLGAEHVARSAPDGHTLLLCASSHVQGSALFRNLPFDPLRDFSAVAMLSIYALVAIVHPAVPVQTLAELVALAKREPGRVTYGSTGVGTPTHLVVELFRLRAGIELTHVPYGGAAPAQTAILAGQVMAMFNNPVLSIPAIRDGALRGLATTGAARMAQLPDLPTVAESGYPGFEAGTWYGVLAPAGLPAALAEQLAGDFDAVLATPQMRGRLATMGMLRLAEGPAGFAGRLAAELESWSGVIRQAGIRMD